MLPDPSYVAYLAKIKAAKTPPIPIPTIPIPIPTIATRAIIADYTPPGTVGGALLAKVKSVEAIVEALRSSIAIQDLAIAKNTALIESKLEATIELCSTSTHTGQELVGAFRLLRERISTMETDIGSLSNRCSVVETRVNNAELTTAVVIPSRPPSRMGDAFEILEEFTDDEE